MMNLKLYTIFAAITMLSSGCKESTPAKPAPEAEPDVYVEAERILPSTPEADTTRTTPETAPRQPFRDGFVMNNGKALDILDAAGRVIDSNTALIRLSDEGGRCPSEGFQRIVVKGDYFTIEQQTCSGMDFVDEYITFKAAPDGRIYLHKFSIVRTDRSDPERNIPQRDLTTSDFGKIGLGDVRLDALYELF